MVKKILKIAGVFIVLEAVIVVIIGLVSKWNSVHTYGDAFTLVGFIDMILGFLSIMGNATNRFNGGYQVVAMRLGRNKVELMKDELSSTRKSFIFLIVMFVIGLIYVLIGELL